MVMIPFFSILPSLVWVWMVMVNKPAFFPFSLLVEEVVLLDWLVEA